VAAPARWRTLDPNLAWRHWPGEEEWVAFSAVSADVHLLNEHARFLVERCTREALSIDHLVIELSRHLGRPADQALSEAVKETVEALDRAGLLEPA